jgi:hypothetical protein
MPETYAAAVQAAGEPKTVDDIAAFAHNYLENLNGFLGAVQNSRAVEDSDVFAEMLRRAFDNYDVKQLEIAGQLEVQTSTVGRWARGESFPNMATRHYVKDVVIKALQEQIARLTLKLP